MPLEIAASVGHSNSVSAMLTNFSGPKDKAIEKLEPYRANPQIDSIVKSLIISDEIEKSLGADITKNRSVLVPII
jgi:hypothetical protein